MDEFFVRLVFKRIDSGDHHVQNDLSVRRAYTQTEQVCLASVVQIVQYLRCDIAGGAASAEQVSEVFFISCKAQINEDWILKSLVVSKHHILGLDVSVDDASFLQVSQSLGEMQTTLINL